jgi:hypothetical protein
MFVGRLISLTSSSRTRVSLSEGEGRKASDPGPILNSHQAHRWVPGRKDRTRTRAAFWRCLNPGMTVLDHIA